MAITDALPVAQGGTGSNTAAGARTNLGAQATDAGLTSLMAVDTGPGILPYTDGANSWAGSAITAAGRALLDDADAAAQRATLALVPGTNVQAYDLGLTSLAALATAGDRVPYTTAADTYAEAVFTAAGRALVDDVDAAAQRATLGVPATADVQPADADLTALAALAGTGLIAHTGAGTMAERTITGTANNVTVADGDGTAANPTITLPTVADSPSGGAIVAGPGLIIKLVMADGATGDVDYTLPATLGNVEIVDVWLKPTGVNGANANTIQVQTIAAGAITDAMVTNAIPADQIVRAVSVFAGESQVASGGVVRLHRVRVGGAVDCIVYLSIIKRA